MFIWIQSSAIYPSAFKRRLLYSFAWNNWNFCMDLWNRPQQNITILTLIDCPDLRTTERWNLKVVSWSPASCLSCQPPRDKSYKKINASYYPPVFLVEVLQLLFSYDVCVWTPLIANANNYSTYAWNTIKIGVPQLLKNDFCRLSE